MRSNKVLTLIFVRIMVFSVISMSAAFVGSTLANHSDDTLLVDGEGTESNHYSTVQTAVNVATDGDIIEIEAGTYDESVNITVASVPIIGESSETVDINIARAAVPPEVSVS